MLNYFARLRLFVKIADRYKVLRSVSWSKNIHIGKQFQLWADIEAHELCHRPNMSGGDLVRAVLVKILNDSWDYTRRCSVDITSISTMTKNYPNMRNKAYARRSSVREVCATLTPRIGAGFQSGMNMAHDTARWDDRVKCAARDLQIRSRSGEAAQAGRLWERRAGGPAEWFLHQCRTPPPESLLAELWGSQTSKGAVAHGV